MSKENCAEYYECQQGRSYLRKCDLQLFFRQDNEICDNADNVKCNGVSAEPVSSFLY